MGRDDGVDSNGEVIENIIPYGISVEEYVEMVMEKMKGAIDRDDIY